MLSSSIWRLLLVAAALIGLAVALQTWYGSEFSPLNSGTEGDVKTSSPPVETLALSSTVSNEEDKQRWGEVDALRKEVAHLRDDLTTLRSQFQAQMTQVKESLAAFSVSDEADDLAVDEELVDGKLIADPEKEEAALIEEEHQRSLARAQANETEFDFQPVDPAWASQADSLIHEAFTSEALKNIAVDNVQCRSTLCRVEVVYEDTDQRLQFENRFPLMVAEMLPSAAMYTIENDDGTHSTIVYLAREDYPLPQDELIE